MDTGLDKDKSLDSFKNEDSVWSKVIAGDVAALGTLYDDYIDNLVAYGIKVCGDKDYTMDCIHDLFVDLYKYRKKLKNTNDVQFYLYLSLKRKINKKYKQKEVFLDPEAYHLVVNSRGGSQSNEARIIDKEIEQEKTVKLAEAVSKLTKTQQKGISLRFKEGKSYEEIANVLGVSVASARTIVYRAIKSLREYSLLIFVFLYFSFFL